MLRLRMDLLPSTALAPHMQMWKLVLAYDGTDFHGWQVQPGLCTIQGELASAIEQQIIYLELKPGANAQDLLCEAVAKATITRFELMEPSLEEIFIRTVGEKVDA